MTFNIMKTKKYTCIEFKIPASASYGDYRELIKREVLKCFPHLRYMSCPDYNPADLNNVVKGPPADQITVQLTPACGCNISFLVSEIPFGDLECPCGKSMYFKFIKG